MGVQYFCNLSGLPPTVSEEQIRALLAMDGFKVTPVSINLPNPRYLIPNVTGRCEIIVESKEDATTLNSLRGYVVDGYPIETNIGAFDFEEKQTRAEYLKSLVALRQHKAAALLKKQQLDAKQREKKDEETRRQREREDELRRRDDRDRRGRDRRRSPSYDRRGRRRSVSYDRRHRSPSYDRRDRGGRRHSRSPSRDRRYRRRTPSYSRSRSPYRRGGDRGGDRRGGGGGRRSPSPPRRFGGGGGGGGGAGGDRGRGRSPSLPRQRKRYSYSPRSVSSGKNFKKRSLSARSSVSYSSGSLYTRSNSRAADKKKK